MNSVPLSDLPPSGPPPEGGFRPLSLLRPAGLFRDRPGRDEPYLQFTNPDGFACFVKIQAVRQMAAFGRAAGDCESIGRLGGRQCQDGSGPYILVERATLTRNARGTAGSIVADIAAQQAAKADFERECRAFDAVGWWHTHLPGVGLFYSGTDCQNQATWNDPNAIGIVLHPGLEQEGLKVFRGPHAEALTGPEGHEPIRSRLQGYSARTHRVANHQAAQAVPTPVQPMSSSVPPWLGIRFGSIRARATMAICLSIVACVLALLALVLAVAPRSDRSRESSASRESRIRAKVDGYLDQEPTRKATRGSAPAPAERTGSESPAAQSSPSTSLPSPSGDVIEDHAPTEDAGEQPSLGESQQDRSETKDAPSRRIRHRTTRKGQQL